MNRPVAPFKLQRLHTLEDQPHLSGARFLREAPGARRADERTAMARWLGWSERGASE